MMRKNKDFNPNNCPVTACLNKIGGKWKTVVLLMINDNKNRFSILMRVIPTISKQMLINQLRELEADGLINRKVFAEVPPRVEYELTRYGKTTLPIIYEMGKWGKLDMDRDSFFLE